jgi:hypothetical protein
VQIELQGGRADGTRLTIPDGTTELAVPVPDSRGFNSSEIYRPSGEFRDGMELWECVDSPWTETGATPLA